MKGGYIKGICPLSHSTTFTVVNIFKKLYKKKIQCLKTTKRLPSLLWAEHVPVSHTLRTTGG